MGSSNPAFDLPHVITEAGGVPVTALASRYGLTISSLVYGAPCASCRVDEGLCPNCQTFWTRREGKRYGIPPGALPSEALMALEREVAARQALSALEGGH